MRVKEILNELDLGKSVAESDQRLDSYFVDTHTFNVLSSAKRDIVAGDKGTGKTALYRILMNRYKTIKGLEDTEVIAAFNVAGNPIFQQLLFVPEQSEGLYIAFWKTYFLSLIGNWMIDNEQIKKHPSVKRVEYFLVQSNLKTADVSPGNIFTKVLARIPTSIFPKALEMEVGVSETGAPTIKPRVEFSAPESAQPPKFFGLDYIAGLKILDASLQELKMKIWIALDRLDEAFSGHHEVEIPALRALLRTYLDLQASENITPKLFLRKDLFRKITVGGFVNLTHIEAQKVEIIWDDEDLLNLLIARVKDNLKVSEALSLDGLSSEEAFYRMFPAKIAQGEKQSNTWKWLLSRLRDGNDVVAPRNLIDFVENCKEAQLRSEGRNPREYSVDTPLFEADAVRKAHRKLSETRVRDTLVAEFPELSVWIKKFQKNKAEHNLDTLGDLFRIPPAETQSITNKLVEIGFLEEVGTSYKVPMLYRDGLDITQGKAFEAGATSTQSVDDVEV